MHMHHTQAFCRGDIGSMPFNQEQNNNIDEDQSVWKYDFNMKIVEKCIKN
jgi:hypothetical protein